MAIRLYCPRADPGFGNGGGKIFSVARNIYERSELRPGVTSEARIDKSAGGSAL